MAVNQRATTAAAPQYLLPSPISVPALGHRGEKL